MTPYLKYKLMAILTSMLEYNPIYFDVYVSLLNVFTVNSNLGDSVLTQAELESQINLILTTKLSQAMSLTADLEEQTNLELTSELINSQSFFAKLCGNSKLSAMAKALTATSMFAFLISKNLANIQTNIATKIGVDILSQLNDSNEIHLDIKLINFANLLFFNAETILSTNLTSSIDNVLANDFTDTLFIRFGTNMLSDIEFAPPLYFESRVNNKSIFTANVSFTRYAILNDYKNNTLVELSNKSLKKLKFL